MSANKNFNECHCGKRLPTNEFHVDCGGCGSCYHFRTEKELEGAGVINGLENKCKNCGLKATIETLENKPVMKQLASSKKDITNGRVVEGRARIHRSK